MKKNITNDNVLLVNDRNKGLAYAMNTEGKDPNAILALLHYLEELIGIGHGIEVLQVFGLHSFGEYNVQHIDQNKTDFYNTLINAGILKKSYFGQ